MDEIFKRRSVRRFAQKEVPDAQIQKILEAGMSAPSAGNEQPWQFVVIKKRQTLDELSEASPYARTLKGAPAGILVLGDLSLERHKGYWVQDCSACVQNMLLEAVSLGLGAVWLGIYPLEERIAYIKQQFALPEQIVPFAIVPVGYPLDEMAPSNRYNGSRVHYESWK
ncbi:MAG: nitroreductase family protein [Candidatus Omnitrophica bacterium]|nr:nitroreductase family protein [Candidatus Omnitrophota bacterium]